MEFLIITGLSGGGKSQAADIIEDLDYYCVDNMPVALIPKFAELCAATKGRYEKVALVTDVREKNGIKDVFNALKSLREMDFGYKILFMEADTQVIVKRYKESRRPHPLAIKSGGSIENAIEREREQLQPIRELADYIVNTSHLTLGQLQNQLYTYFSDAPNSRSIMVNVVSFGFKYGMPLDADLVFDVRFLPNPYYVEELRLHSGLDADVRDYVFGFKQTTDFMDKLVDMIEFLIPLYIEEGKYSLTIAIGCTGGRHRSVAVATALGEHLRCMDYNVADINRDLNKGG
ncbi:MAG: RNase adapter RapZ [Clostridiales bacterium]|nr:RNase adapter RapZ [Clostridiales bacterium]